MTSSSDTSPNAVSAMVRHIETGTPSQIGSTGTTGKAGAELVQHHIEEPSPFSCDAMGLRPDTGTIPIAIRYSNTNWNGTPGLVGFITDLSEHRKMEEERRAIEAHTQRSQRLEAIGTLAGESPTTSTTSWPPS